MKLADGTTADPEVGSADSAAHTISHLSSEWLSSVKNIRQADSPDDRGGQQQENSRSRRGAGIYRLIGTSDAAAYQCHAPGQAAHLVEAP